MSRFSDHAIDQHNNRARVVHRLQSIVDNQERNPIVCHYTAIDQHNNGATVDFSEFGITDPVTFPNDYQSTVRTIAERYESIEPVALSMIVRGLVGRITALERTQHELKARIRELEEPYNP